jgi:hypothetical protein
VDAAAATEATSGLGQEAATRPADSEATAAGRPPCDRPNAAATDSADGTGSPRPGGSTGGTGGR